MLSYRHAFHAGNHADVLKHLVLINSLQQLIQKPAPILYIDSHAGAGSYQTDNAISRKTNEYAKGAARMQPDALPDSFACYGKLLTNSRQRGIYPGSPLLAAHILREQDRLNLFELHPKDHSALEALFARDRRVKIVHSDGFQALKALLPAKLKRALILMDPSYEILSDYKQVVTTLKEGYKRMPNATYLLWYPVVQRRLITRMKTQLCDSKMRDLWQFELGILPDTDDYGMTASGLFAINPPWRLIAQLQTLLPAIQQVLAPEQGFYQIENIIAETNSGK